MPIEQLENKIFRNEELWESKHALDATQLTRIILDSKYQKFDLSRIASDSKNLSSDKQSMIYNSPTKFEFLLCGTLVTWKLSL